MKKLFLAVVAVLVTAFSANAQVKIESPHPDLDVQITRCAYANGTVVIDMVITNFGADELVRFSGSMFSYDDYTTAYDDEGNQYGRSNSDISLGFISKGLDNVQSSMIMPQDIPLKFRVQLKKVNPDSSKFLIFKIGVSSNGAMDLKYNNPIIIRNLEWVK